MGLFSGIVDTVKNVAGAVGDFVSPGIGSLLGGGLSYLGQNSANQANAQQAAQQMAFQEASTKEQMDFQERMSNTAYQRGIADLKAAGVNPMLAYAHAGASSPTGSSSSGASAQMQNALGSGVQSGFKGAMTAATIDQMEQQNRNLRATNEQIHAQTDALDTQSALNKVNALKSVAETNLTTQSAANAAVNNKLLQSAVPKAANEAAAQSSWWMKNVSPYLPDFLKSTSSAGSIMRMTK
jgi:hypothetical protein